MVVHGLIFYGLLRILADTRPLFLICQLLKLVRVLLRQPKDLLLRLLGHLLIGFELPDLPFELTSLQPAFVIVFVFDEGVEFAVELLRSFVLRYLRQVSHSLLEGGLQIDVLLGVAGVLRRM